jgi:hypothetical protein
MTDTHTRMQRPRTWQEMRDQQIAWLIERTGEGLDAWNARIVEQDFEDQASLRRWLTEQGVTGYPQMLLVMERFGYPDYLRATADDLIEGQYADRQQLRPILDAIFALLPGIGDVEVQARKTYVALLTPRRTFAAVQPTTRSRIDLGVRLSPRQEPTARLERARNFGQSSVTHIIRLGTPEAVDEEVEDWLRKAYQVNA